MKTGNLSLSERKASVTQSINNNPQYSQITHSNMLNTQGRQAQKV